MDLYRLRTRSKAENYLGWFPACLIYPSLCQTALQDCVTAERSKRCDSALRSGAGLLGGDDSAMRHL